MSSSKSYKLRAPQPCKACGRKMAKGDMADVYVDGYGDRSYSHPAPCPRVQLSEPMPDLAEAAQNFVEAMKGTGS